MKVQSMLNRSCADKKDSNSNFGSVTIVQP